MQTRTLWRWFWAAGLAAFAQSAAHGCALVAGIEEPAKGLEHCINGVQDSDHDEVGIDCGGKCGRCPGDTCADASECASGVCDDAKRCKAPGCDDHVFNGLESSVDCGGPDCAPCKVGDACRNACDCATENCDLETLLCGAPSDGSHCDPCKNKVKDPSEGDLDCGGSCSKKCADGKGCQAAADCESGACDLEKHQCTKGGCGNGALDGDEADVDCGGSCATKCGVGKACQSAGDCESAYCDLDTHQCSTAGCSNGILDGDETDLDCGGGTCPQCKDGRVCSEDTDCVVGNCSFAGVCTKATCEDGEWNGGESYLDCGGKDTGCKRCGFDDTCDEDADCLSSNCISGAHCGSCPDGAKNGVETDIDCGGGDCAKCPDNKACKVDADCMSGWCASGACTVPTCSDGFKNQAEVGVDCGGPNCLLCNSATCTVSNECKSGVCVGSMCAAATCTDGTKNGSETDTDCGGLCSSKCTVGQACLTSADCDKSCDLLTHQCQ